MTLTELLLICATLFGGSFLAHFVIQWFYTPKLRLTMQAGQLCKMTTDLTDYIFDVATGRIIGEQPGGQGQWIRLCVQNVGYGTARGCRAFLAVVYSETDDYKLDRLIWDCIPLNWSNQGGNVFELPTGIDAVVDVVWAKSKDNVLRACVVQPQPSRYAKLFDKPGKYRLVITIGADNCDAATFTVRIRWTGQWDQIEILNELYTDAEKRNA